jgi:hypothetical protein
MYMGILSYSYDSIVLFPTGGGNAWP